MATVRRLFEPSEDTVKLRSYLSELEDGIRVGWIDVERATGVHMDERGHSLVRTTMRRLGRWYIPIPGFGFETSQPNTARDIVLARARRIKGAVDSATTATQQLLGRHAAEMTTADRQSLEHTSSTLATLSLIKSLATRNR